MVKRPQNLSDQGHRPQPRPAEDRSGQISEGKQRRYSSKERDWGGEGDRQARIWEEGAGEPDSVQGTEHHHAPS